MPFIVFCMACSSGSCACGLVSGRMQRGVHAALAPARAPDCGSYVAPPHPGEEVVKVADAELLGAADEFEAKRREVRVGLGDGRRRARRARHQRRLAAADAVRCQLCMQAPPHAVIGSTSLQRIAAVPQQW